MCSAVNIILFSKRQYLFVEFIDSFWSNLFYLNVGRSDSAFECEVPYGGYHTLETSDVLPN